MNIWEFPIRYNDWLDGVVYIMFIYVYRMGWSYQFLFGWSDHIESYKELMNMFAQKTYDHQMNKTKLWCVSFNYNCKTLPETNIQSSHLKMDACNTIPFFYNGALTKKSGPFLNKKNGENLAS